MSFIQELQGITVVPSPALRRSNLLKNASMWPRGYAFGGWIFDVQTDLGFSKQPTQITLNLVLENDNSVVNQKEFEINDNLLTASMVTYDTRLDHPTQTAANFFEEKVMGHFYTIHLHGLTFNRMYLFDYSISIEATQKVLTVVFKDYSIILDKIYIGLANRQGPDWGKHSGEKAKAAGLVKEAQTNVWLTAFCPNCYLVGGGAGKASYGANLGGFFSKQTGLIKRDSATGSFMGRAAPRRGTPALYANLFNEKATAVYKQDFKCFKATQFNATRTTPLSNVSECTSLYPNGLHPNAMPWDKYSPPRFPIREYWNELARRAWFGIDEPEGFTMDGGYLMLGTEEFEERQCGAAAQISYNFSELLNSLKIRGLKFSNLPDGTWPDKKPTYRANYIGTLREVLEQWCAVFGLDFYYSDKNIHSINQGFHFIDLAKGADISAVRYVTDPTTAIGSEFGVTPNQSSVIISYKESSTLSNTYMQSVITSNVKPFTVKERKKEVKRYINMMPLHPLDFSIPNYLQLPNQKSVLGQTYTESKYANFIPWYSQVRNLPDSHDARKRVWQRTNRELWDTDTAIALAKYDKNLRDIYVGTRIIENSRSELVPIKVYPPGHRDPATNQPTEKDGSAIKYLINADGSVGREATSDELKIQGVKTCINRWRFSSDPDNPYPTVTQKKDLKANFSALGFECLAEIEDSMVKQNVIDVFLNKQDIEDINMDASHYKMYVGYYDETLHNEYVAWEQRCAEAMYGFGAIVQGTLPGYPYIPENYYGIRDGDLGFEKGSDGISVPKLVSSFEPQAARYPLQSLMTPGEKPDYTLEAFNAPYNGVLINSGNYLPTGLYISQLDNPWGMTKEEWEKKWFKAFQDNACEAFNNQMNIIEDAGYDSEILVNSAGNPMKDPNTGKTLTKKIEDPFPYKKQTWNIGMFTPKFFTDTTNIVDVLNPLMQNLYQEGKLVDEISIDRWDIDFSHRRVCKKVTVMILSDVRPGKHTNCSFNAYYTNLGSINPQAKRQRELWEYQEHKRKEKDDIRNRCERDILYEFCEDAVKNSPTLFNNYGPWGSIDKDSCAVDPTGVYKEGFAKDLIGGYKYPNGVTANGRANSRILRVEVIRNPGYPHYIPTSDLGAYHLQDLETELDALDEKAFKENIIYPINNYELNSWDGNLGRYVANSNPLNNPPMQYYSGIWSAAVSIEDRMPELIEIYGHPPAIANPTAGVKIVNNTIDPDLGALMDPDSKMFVTKMYDVYGNEIKGIEDYHYSIAGYYDPVANFKHIGMDDFNVIHPTKKVDLKLAGSLLNFPNFRTICDPSYGLINFTISLSENGSQTSLSFADRPPAPPQMENILNKISPRTM